MYVDLSVIKLLKTEDQYKIKYFCTSERFVSQSLKIVMVTPFFIFYFIFIF